MRPCVIFNPAARGERARGFRSFLEALGSECELRPTTGEGSGRWLAREAVGAGHEQIIAAGGDGTVNEVLNGIADAPDGLGRAVLGVIPLGTVNVFAQELGMPMEVAAAWRALRHGAVRSVDLPGAEFNGETGRQRRHFAQLAGAGLDASAVRRVNWGLKKRWGRLAYLVACLQAWRQTPARVWCHPGGTDTTMALAVLGNGRFYADRVEIFPGARLDDGLVHGCFFPRVTARIVAGALAAYYLTRHWAPPPEVRRIQATEFSFTSDPPAPLQLDGEFVGWLPARIWTEPARLRVLAPGAPAVRGAG